MKNSMDLLAETIPDSFADIRDALTDFIGFLGEERCSEVYAVCKGYSVDEMDFIMLGMMDDISRLLPLDKKSGITEGKVNRTHKLLMASAYAAPAATAFGIAGNKQVKTMLGFRDGIRGIFRLVGEVINMSRADSLVVEFPDMDRHDPVIVTGAITALVLPDPHKCSSDLIRYLGENWRALSKYKDDMASMKDFDIHHAIHLAEGGSAPLTVGAL